MKNFLVIEGKKYISSREASRLTGYSSDYVGQLSRAGKIDARFVGRSWYVGEESLLKYKNLGLEEASKFRPSANREPDFSRFFGKLVLTAFIGLVAFGSSAYALSFPFPKILEVASTIEKGLVEKLAPEVAYFEKVKDGLNMLVGDIGEQTASIFDAFNKTVSSTQLSIKSFFLDFLGIKDSQPITQVALQTATSTTVINQVVKNTTTYSSNGIDKNYVDQNISSVRSEINNLRDFQSRQITAVYDSAGAAGINVGGGGGGGISDLSSFDTADLLEGTNLYFTDSRVLSSLASATSTTFGGNVTATTFFGDGSNLTGLASSQWTTNGSNIYYNLGNVGIGSTSPSAKLTVAGQTTGEYFTATSTTAASVFPLLRNGEVIIKHSNGSQTSYTTSVNTDSARGTTLLSAVSALVNGDTLYLSANTFDLGANGIDLTKGGTINSSLIGSGMYNTVIKSSRDSVSATLADSSIVIPSSNSEVAHLSIIGNAASGTFQIPYGNVDSSVDVLNARVHDVYMSAQSDAIFFKSETNNHFSIKAERLVLSSNYDTINFWGNANVLYIYDSIASSTAVAAINGANTARALVAQEGSEIYSYNSNYSAKNATGLNHAVVAADGSVIRIYGGVITSTSGFATPKDLHTVDGDIYVTSNTIYDPTKIGDAIHFQDNPQLRYSLGSTGTAGKFLYTDGTTADWSDTVYLSASQFLSEQGVGVFENNKFVLDADGDQFSWLVTDAANTYSQGANAFVLGSKNGEFAFVHGEDSGQDVSVVVPHGIFRSANIQNDGAYTDSQLSDGSNGMVLKSTGTATEWVATSSLGITSSQWTTSGSNIYFNTGNVGIGSTSPSSKLTVSGDSYLGGNVTATGTLSIGTSSPATLANNGAGGITVTAAGTNQSITLTPSGTGQVLLPVGAQGTPSIGFLGDTQTGLYRYATNQIGFVSGNTVTSRLLSNRFEFANDKLLTWANDSSFSTTDSGLSRNAAGQLEINSGTAGTWRDLIVRNLSMGTTSTSTTLTVQGQAGKSVFNFASSTGTSLLSMNQTGQLLTGNGSSLVLKVNNGSNITFWSDSSVYATYFGSGNACLSTPSTGLATINACAGTTNLRDLGIRNLSMGTSSQSATLTLQGVAGKNALSIASSTGTNLLTVTQAGNVGIFNASPANPLVVASAAGSGGVSMGTWPADNGYGAIRMGTGALSSTNYTLVGASGVATILNSQTAGQPLQFAEAGSIKASLLNGNFGISSSSPSSKLTVSGSSFLGGNVTATGTLALTGLSLANEGNYLCIDTTTNQVTSGTVCSGSSNRFKQNVQDLNLGLNTVLALRPVTFNFKQGYGDNGATDQLGFVAEEADAVDPRLVPHDKDGLPSGFNYANYTAVLTKAIQEQQIQIDALKNATSSATIIQQTVAATTSTTSIALELQDSPSFITTIAQAVKNIISSAGELVVSTIRSTLAIFDRVETKELCVGQTCVTEDQLKILLANANVQPAVNNPVIVPPTSTSTPELATSTEPIATSTPEITPTPEPEVATSTPPEVVTEPAPVSIDNP